MFARIIQGIIAWFEKQAFGVCTYLGNKLGIKSTTIRMYFIYLSFFTFGSPIILYFILAFLLENKKFFVPTSNSRKRIWDL
jgi:phage shock protein PspC (stress-responsive transcriptional regulator)